MLALIRLFSAETSSGKVVVRGDWYIEPDPWFPGPPVIGDVLGGTVTAGTWGAIVAELASSCGADRSRFV